MVFKVPQELIGRGLKLRAVYAVYQRLRTNRRKCRWQVFIQLPQQCQDLGLCAVQSGCVSSLHVPEGLITQVMEETPADGCCEFVFVSVSFQMCAVGFAEVGGLHSCPESGAWSPLLSHALFECSLHCSQHSLPTASTNSLWEGLTWQRVRA